MIILNNNLILAPHNSILEKNITKPKVYDMNYTPVTTGIEGREGEGRINPT